MFLYYFIINPTTSDNKMHFEPNFHGFFDQRPEYPNPNISSVCLLKDFIEHYPNDLLVPNLTKLQRDYKYYRAIRGDGNCFYRAVMFQYLRDADIDRFQGLFPLANMFNCIQLPFQRQEGFTPENILLYIWQTYLLPMSQLRKEEREKPLEEMLNSSKNLDALLIAYFRALNYEYILSRKDQFRNYSENINGDLQRIKSYGQQSELVELNALAMILEAQITIFMVDQDGYRQINLNDEGVHNNHFIVSYRPGHYDLPVKQKVRQMYRETTPRHSAAEQVISVKNLMQIKRIPFKTTDETNNSINRRTWNDKKPPAGMIDFRNSLGENKQKFNKSTVTNCNSSSIRPSESQIPNQKLQKESPKPTQNKPVKILKTNIAKQRQMIKKQTMVKEASFCVFAFAMLVTSLILL